MGAFSMGFSSFVGKNTAIDADNEAAKEPVSLGGGGERGRFKLSDDVSFAHGGRYSSGTGGCFGNGSGTATAKTGRMNAMLSTDTNDESFDIIIMDNLMPIMCGDEATRRIRELGFEGLMLGLTGCSLAEDMSSFANTGLDYVFSKPIDLDHFVDVTTWYLTKGKKGGDDEGEGGS
jgi:CheY-like chemotaxis protein